MDPGSVLPAACRGVDYSPDCGTLKADLATDLGTSKSSHRISPKDCFERFYSLLLQFNRKHRWRVMGSLHH